MQPHLHRISTVSPPYLPRDTLSPNTPRESVAPLEGLTSL